MKRGRPPGSPVRQNMIELLAQFGELHGYDAYRHYAKIFPTVSMRAVYYCLRKGAKNGYFKVARTEKKAGTYSWGPEAQRVYYALGELAKPAGDLRVKRYYDEQLRRKKQDGSIVNLKPKDWGKGTERLSEEIDKVLY